LFQNTYTNAEKLLTAAEELARTGECNAAEIYGVARELESHVTSFAARVEERRRRLDLAALFYAHDNQVSDSVMGRASAYRFHDAGSNLFVEIVVGVLFSASKLLLFVREVQSSDSGARQSKITQRSQIIFFCRSIKKIGVPLAVL